MHETKLVRSKLTCSSNLITLLSSKLWGDINHNHIWFRLHLLLYMVDIHLTFFWVLFVVVFWTIVSYRCRSRECTRGISTSSLTMRTDLPLTTTTTLSLHVWHYFWDNIRSVISFLFRGAMDHVMVHPWLSMGALDSHNQLPCAFQLSISHPHPHPNLGRGPPR